MLDIFTFTAEDYSLTEADEAATIDAAQQGDERAKMTLLRAYGPALRAAVGRFKGGLGDGQVSRSNDYGTPSSAVEDLQSAAVVSFLEIIETHDPRQNPRLAGRVTAHLADSLATQFSREAQFAIPKRTLTRFFGIMKAADGDVVVAESLLSDYGMSMETFRSILAAVSTTSFDSFAPGEDEGRGAGDVIGQSAAEPVYSATPISDVEDRILVDMAFRPLNDEEVRIVELAYGFTEYDPVPDAEIGHRMSLSRPAVQRRRASALSTMRKTLGVTPE